VTFDIVKDILLERLGTLPAISPEKQLEEIIDNVKNLLEERNFTQAFALCEQAIQLAPYDAVGYYWRGITCDHMDQFEAAMADYQKAIHMDPKYGESWEDMLSLERDLKEDFQESQVKQSLDKALEFAVEGNRENSLLVLEKTKAIMPALAEAWNYRGMVFEELELIEPAIECYLEALRLNPRFWNARENLGDARYKLIEEMCRRPPEEFVDEETGNRYTIPDSGDEHLLGKMNVEESLPAWLYINERSYVERGCPGYRLRPGRSGYDYLDFTAEQARIEGIIIHKLFTGKFCTHNLVYWILMVCIGLIFCIPIFGIINFLSSDIWGVVLYIVMFGPYIVIGLGLLYNALLSLLTQPTADDRMTGSAFY
jgi:hypothetical protein